MSTSLRVIERSFADHAEIDRFRNEGGASDYDRLISFCGNANYHGGSDVMTPHLNLLAYRVGKAMRDAERISKREHIKADRSERVCQFVVCLRREIGLIPTGPSYGEGSDKVIESAMKANYMETLCNKAIWHDIGVLNIGAASHYLSNLALIQIVGKAKTSTAPECLASETEGALEDLAVSLASAKIYVEEAERINQEGDKLLEQLAGVFD